MSRLADPVIWSTAAVVVEACAITAFALSGILEAARKRLDAVGVAVVAFLAAFGGGTLRDILLDRRPFFWVEHSWYLWGLFALCAVALAWMRQRHFQPTERAMQWADALGLGLFSAAGTQMAWTLQMPAVAAVLMGVVSAIFGGVLRDIVCNEIPSALRDHRPYAICAFAGSWVVIGATEAGIEPTVALLLSAAVITALRSLAIWRDWRVPAWRVDE